MPAYVPEKGDFITLSFDPQSGHEQKGRRPALVISNFLFNRATGLAIACPVTNTSRNIPFHLPVPASSSLTGFVMVEQVKSVDYNTRKAKFVEKAPLQFVEDIIAMVDVYIK
ncbi:MAG: mRNA-degrading endonuclease [Acidobacteria bacterium 13_1_20CM_3_53_8]|nr:MAG: mRNA-degrading endonuclease [Acidobacteria bacterium 13_1_20CM_3_53_8]